MTIVCMKVKEFHEFFYPTFSKEDSLRDEKGFFSISIFNSPGITLNPCVCVNEISRYTTTEELPICYLEMKPTIEYINALKVMEAWLGWLALAIKLKEVYPHELL